MDHVATIFGRQGADAWWTLPVDALVPAGTVCGGCGAPASKFERERDIVDVWFESGCSWLAMRSKEPADGTTAARRSTCTSRAPTSTAAGSTARSWPASACAAAARTARSSPTASCSTTRACRTPRARSRRPRPRARSRATSRPRTSSRSRARRCSASGSRRSSSAPTSRTRRPCSTGWPTGTASTATPPASSSARWPTSRPNGPGCSRASAQLRAVDRYMLDRIDDLVTRCVAAYQRYELHLVHRALVDFVTGDLSALYSDVVKDRLYCDAADSPDRRAAQVVLYEAIRALATLSAPIMCFTAEDIWAFVPRRPGDPDSVHLAEFPTVASTADGAAATTGGLRPGAGLARAGDQGARGVPRRQAQVDRRPRDDHGAGGGPRGARPATLESWPTCASCQRSCSPLAPRRSRSWPTRAHGVTAAGSTCPRWRPTRATSARAAPSPSPAAPPPASTSWRPTPWPTPPPPLPPPAPLAWRVT
jgi:hypothetical protein